VSDIRNVISGLQKYSLSVDRGCSHYEEGGPRKRTYPVKHVNVGKAVTELNIYSDLYGINLQV